MISTNNASVLGLSGEWICPALHERARQAGVKVRIAVETSEYFHAHTAIDAAEAEELSGGTNDAGQSLDAALSAIGLDVHIVNKLEKQGIFTVGQVLHVSQRQLLAIDGFGPGTVERIARAAAEWIGRPVRGPGGERAC
jgi:DNA-directed RNA polymerase alpha subunit